jgi:membrane protease YdiL (CAAX protease family)
MSAGASALGCYALLSRPALRKQRPAAKDVLPGLLSAGGLYLIFQIGDRMARRIMPSGEEDIARVYALRSLAPKAVTAVLLIGVIGPSEELFWRGMVQEAFMRKMGRWRGTAASAATYGAVHLVTGNVTLTGAAATAGAYWGAQYTLRPALGPLLVSHVVWDIWIFLLQPTPTGYSSPS